MRKGLRFDSKRRIWTLCRSVVPCASGLLPSAPASNSKLTCRKLQRRTAYQRGVRPSSSSAFVSARPCTSSCTTWLQESSSFRRSQAKDNAVLPNGSLASRSARDANSTRKTSTRPHFAATRRGAPSDSVPAVACTSRRTIPA